MANNKRGPSRRDVLLALGALASGLHAQAEEAPPQLQAELLKTGLYLISGGGGNSLLRFSANGLVLVNGKSPESYKPLMSQVPQDQQARGHAAARADPDQRAGSASRQQRPFRCGQSADPGASQRGASTGRQRCGAGALRTRLFDEDRRRRDPDQLLRTGSDRCRRGRLLSRQKIVAVGDLYSPEAPRLDAAAGGNLLGWSAALTQVLALEFDQAVPNLGPPISRGELAAFKSQLDALLT